MMFSTTLYIIGLGIFMAYCKNINLEENALSSCVTGKEAFWNVYRYHFSSAKSVTISVLLTRERYLIIKEFTDMNINYLFQNLNVTVKSIKKFLYNYNKSPNDRPKFSFFYSKPNAVDDNFDTFQRIKRLSSEPSSAHVIIIWDQEDLHRFLDMNPGEILLNPRGIYVIFFVYTKSEECFELKEQIGGVLVRLWKQFEVLNVIAQSPCSCEPERIYKYEPFRKLNNSYGVLVSYTLEEVIKDRNALTHSIVNMNGYPLKVSVFGRNPTFIFDKPKMLRNNGIYKNTQGYEGVDGCILTSLAKTIFFEPKVYFPVDNKNFGDTLPNGSQTGSLKEVVEKRADFAANSRFVSDYGTNEIEFTKAVTGNYICAVVRKSKRIPQWLLIFRCFKILTWISILCILLLYSTFWYYYRGSFQKAPRDFKAFLEIFSLFLGQPVKLKPKNCQHLFLGAFIVFNVIIVGIFQGTLMTSFSKISYYKDIDTLEELAIADLTIATSLNILDGDHSPLITKLRKKKQHVEGNALGLVANNPNYACLERRDDANFFIKLRFMREDGIPLLHVVDECFASYFVAFIVRKYSPYLMIFNYRLSMFLENGLLEKWNKDYIEAIILEKWIHSESTSTKYKPFTLNDVQTAFFCLILGHVLGILMFSCELLYYKQRVLNKH